MKKYLITNHIVAKPNQVYNTIDFLSVIKKKCGRIVHWYMLQNV